MKTAAMIFGLALVGSQALAQDRPGFTAGRPEPRHGRR